MVQTPGRARVAVSAAFMLQGLVFASIVTQVPRLRARLDWNEDDVTIVLVLVALLSGAGSVLAGMLAERRSSAVALRVSLLVVAVAAFSIGLAPVPAAAYAAFAVYGIGLGGVDATMNMQGVRLQQRSGRSLMAGFHGLWSVGGILGAGFAAGANALDLPLAVILGVVALGVVVVIVLIGPDLVHDETGSLAELGSVAPPWRPVLVFGFVILMFFAVDTGTQTWSSTYLDMVFDAPTWLVPLGYAAYQAGALASRLTADRLVMSVGAARVVAAGTVVGAVGFAVVSMAPSAPVAIGGFLVAGIGLAVLAPLAFAALGAAVDPRALDGAIARMNIANYVGAILGGGSIGLLTGLGSMRIAFAVPVVCALVLLFLAPAFRDPAGAPARLPEGQ